MRTSSFVLLVLLMLPVTLFAQGNVVKAVEVTAPGNRVGDWFAGSGTTAAVAQRLGRGFITVDREPAAIDVCRTRLTQQGAQLAAQGTPPPPIHVDLVNNRRR